jgi:hypothetical protein
VFFSENLVVIIVAVIVAIITACNLLLRCFTHPIFIRDSVLAPNSASPAALTTPPADPTTALQLH